MVLDEAIFTVAVLSTFCNNNPAKWLKTCETGYPNKFLKQENVVCFTCQHFSPVKNNFAYVGKELPIFLLLVNYRIPAC